MSHDSTEIYQLGYDLGLAEYPHLQQMKIKDIMARISALMELQDQLAKMDQRSLFASLSDKLQGTLDALADFVIETEVIFS